VQPEPAKSKPLPVWIATDPKSATLLEQAQKIAASHSTVLIRGESGVGKDLLAALIHYFAVGLEGEDPLVKIDCASLPHELMESELFGYEPGAFTGATHLKHGRLELAGNGTIVLDEVSALTLAMQAKLLRVLEEKRFHRLGGESATGIEVNARIIALSNTDLEQAIVRRTFREDLFYRLNVIPLLVAPLRERGADIRPLAQHLLAQLNGSQRESKPISAAALDALERYAFPGNVRELRNILERALLHARGSQIEVEDLPANVVHGKRTESMKSLEEIEREHIAAVLDHTRGKKSKAAEILGISRKNLLEKRKKYKLDQ
jgi:two-component system, NtrC family, response regulator AtoC